MPYFVVLEATNNAELTTRAISKPIIVDILGPHAGRVVDGSLYQEDLLYQGQASMVEGQAKK